MTVHKVPLKRLRNCGDFGSFRVSLVNACGTGRMEARGRKRFPRMRFYNLEQFSTKLHFLILLSSLKKSQKAEYIDVGVLGSRGPGGFGLRSFTMKILPRCIMKKCLMETVIFSTGNLSARSSQVHFLVLTNYTESRLNWLLVCHRNRMNSITSCTQPSKYTICLDCLGLLSGLVDHQQRTRNKESKTIRETSIFIRHAENANRPFKLSYIQISSALLRSNQRQEKWPEKKTLVRRQKK